MSTIPQRDSVQLTIYNSEDITLVRETRKLTFKQGMNPLQFSWANTLIDSSSVQLRFLDRKDQLELVDTTFPYDRPQMLEWGVKSAIDGEAMVEITYFTSGISWSADYVCVSNAEETSMSLDGFVRVANSSGEDYRDANVRLVVGTISLVEKISELAARGIVEQQIVDKLAEGESYRELRRDLPMDARNEMDASLEARFGRPGSPGEPGDPGAKPKEIIKEGLSEYFIYSVEGTETVPNGWSKRFRLFESSSVPFTIEYRWRRRSTANSWFVSFCSATMKPASLGRLRYPTAWFGFTATMAAMVWRFTQRMNKYVPIGQEIELNLGRDPEVVHERLVLSNAVQNFWFTSKTPNKYFSPTQGDRIEPDYAVAGWDLRSGLVERIRNYRSKPIKVQFRLEFRGDISFESQLKPVLHNFQSPQFEATIGQGATEDLAYIVVHRLGVNQKQQRVELR